MAAPRVLASLGPGGRSLWRGLAYDGMSEREVALMTEACRTRDRLDKLDRYLTGEDEWLRLVENVPGVHQVVVDNALARANSAAATLRGLLDALPESAVKPAVKSSPARKDTPLDELAAKRRTGGARQAAARPTRPSSRP